MGQNERRSGRSITIAAEPAGEVYRCLPQLRINAIGGIRKQLIEEAGIARAAALNSVPRCRIIESDYGAGGRNEFQLTLCPEQLRHVLHPQHTAAHINVVVVGHVQVLIASARQEPQVELHGGDAQWLCEIEGRVTHT